MWIGWERFQQCGIIKSRPCQNARMKGWPWSQKRRGMSPRMTRQRQVTRTSRIYQAPSQQAKRLMPSDRMTRFSAATGRSTFRGRHQDGLGLIRELQFVELLVEAAARQQFRVGALFDDAALVDDVDQVGVHDRR